MPEVNYEFLDIHSEIEAATIPGTDDVVRSYSTVETKRAWLAACKERGIDLSNHIRQFHHAACLALSPLWRSKRCGFVSEDSAEILRQPRLIGIADLEAFYHKTTAWWKSDEIVPQEEAERRAHICRMCPRNQIARFGGCPSCTGIFSRIAEKVFSFVSGRKVSGEELQSCGVCGCDLKILMFAPLAALQVNTTDEQKAELPSFCWQK